MGKMRRPPQIRASKELVEIINFVRSAYMLQGKKPPEIRKITKEIAKKINKKELLNDIVIKF